VFISRLVVKNFRNLPDVDIPLQPGLNCLVGENNSGKTNLLYALQLVLDSNLPNSQRRLQLEDFSRGIDFSNPAQILIGVELTEFDATSDSSKAKEQAFAHEWQIDDDKAVVCFRFRPTELVRQSLSSGSRESDSLSLEDYDWEWVGGAALDDDDNLVDLAKVDWTHDFCVAIRPQVLAAYRVGSLPALRDVEQDFRSRNASPLQKLIDLMDFPEDRREALVAMIRKVNEEVAKEKEVASLAKDIDDSFESTVGKFFHQKLGIGIADPSFGGLTRSLRVLFSDHGLSSSELFRNGLGLNNTIYMSILLRCFDLQRQSDRVAGHLLLIEEPEAHLHPQVQQILVTRFLDKKCQIVATTHSTHISSKTHIPNLIILTSSKEEQTSVFASSRLGLSNGEVKDLERYLDATKSVLFFAKKILLVEGMAEGFLLPALIGHFKKVSFEEMGISIVPIHGIHFDCFMKLFGEKAIRRKCAVLTDGDLKPSDGDEVDSNRIAGLKSLESEYVKVFSGTLTLEKDLAAPENLKLFERAAESLARSGYQKSFENWSKRADALSAEEIVEARNKALALAKAVGKARFAQTAAGLVSECKVLPKYIGDAVDWLIA